MVDMESFIRVVNKKPRDNFVRLAFADWLDEHGQTVLAHGYRWAVEYNRAPGKETHPCVNLPYYWDEPHLKLPPSGSRKPITWLHEPILKMMRMGRISFRSPHVAYVNLAMALDALRSLYSVPILSSAVLEGWQ